MTIALNRLLAHMSWANQKTIAHLQTLPEQSLSAFATNPKWQVSEIIHHIVDSADAYAFRITGKHPQLPGDSIPEIGVIADLALIAKQAAAIDAALLEAVSLDDDATEHRAQIASALEAKGFTPVDLDELDLWAFEIETEH